MHARAHTHVFSLSYEKAKKEKSWLVDLCLDTHPQIKKWSPSCVEVYKCFLFAVPQVRWADLEEKKEQSRRRELGFVVGQTQKDWDRITDDNLAEKALNQTKYIWILISITLDENSTAI